MARAKPDHVRTSSVNPKNRTPALVNRNILDRLTAAQNDSQPLLAAQITLNQPRSPDAHQLRHLAPVTIPLTVELLTPSSSAKAC